MASDPSADPLTKRSHARKASTPVTPILPLLLSDRKWKKPSSIIAQETVAHVLTTPVQEEPEPSPSLTDLNPERPVVLDNDQQEQSGIQKAETPGSPSSDAHFERHRAPELQSGAALQTDSLSPQGNNVHPEQEVTTPIAERIQDLPPNTLIESRDDQLQDAPRQAEAGSQSVTSPDEPTNFDTATVVEGRRVKLSEEETQPSEHEASSLRHSSTTGLTDYSSTAGDSTLETVVNEGQQKRRVSGMPHRKSEVAPEALTNGFSPRSRADTQGSHAVNGSTDGAQHLPQALVPAPLPNVQEHLLFLASSKQFCDIVLQVNQADRSYQPSLHYAHSILLVRSENLGKLISEYDPSAQARVMNFNPARNVLPHAFEAALRFFYSDQVLTAQTLVPYGTYQDKQAKAQTLEYIMSYWMAGIELGLEPVQTRSREMIRQVVDWDTVEIVAKEVQDLRSAEDRLTNGHSRAAILDALNTLLIAIARFFVDKLPIQDFVLDANAQTEFLPTRFAHVEFNRPHNPALSSVVFGSLSSQPAPTISPVSVASSILLNIDHADLHFIGEELVVAHGRDAEVLMRRIIQQREEKREHVISNRSISNKQRMDNDGIWNAVGWKEYINEHGSLTQERVGYTLPIKGR